MKTKNGETERVIVNFGKEEWEAMQKLRKHFNESKSGVVLSVVRAFLFEKGYLKGR